MVLVDLAADVAAGFNTPSQVQRLARRVFCVKVDGSHLHMMIHRVVLGAKISKISISWAPQEFKLVLALAVSKPMKTHVHGL